MIRVQTVQTGAQRKSYFRFSERLYQGDAAYVYTQTFSARALVYRQTDFAKSCYIEPIIAYRNGEPAAVCTYIHNPKLPLLQMALFDALPDADDAVNALTDGARMRAKRLGLSKIVVGLNGHLSYGVGILESGFGRKMSFDSLYNKSGYREFFASYVSKTETLSVYRAPTSELAATIKPFRPRENLYIREADLKHFARETETMRRLCNATLGKTFLFTHADAGHFSQQMSAMRYILKNENLLFAMKDGREAGFLFWHPDFNEPLAGGKRHNLPQIFFGSRQAQKKCNTVKINAIGSVDDNPYVTAALVAAMVEKGASRFSDAETTFVWDNNERSALLNRSLFGEPYKKYGVYFIDV